MTILARVAALSVVLALGAAPALADSATSAAAQCGPGRPVTGRLLASLRRRYGLGSGVCVVDAGKISPNASVNGELILGDRVIVIYQGYRLPPLPPPPPVDHGTPPRPQ